MLRSGGSIDTDGGLPVLLIASVMKRRSGIARVCVGERPNLRTDFLYVLVAQQEERLPPKRKVGGSNPPGDA